MSCGPINRLVMLRTRGLAGPFFQNVGNVCVHSAGNSLAVGDAPRAYVGTVDGDTVVIYFSKCVDVISVTGIEASVNGGAWLGVSAPVELAETRWQFTLSVVTDGGDEVRWRSAGAGEIKDCAGEDLNAQGPITLRNLQDPDLFVMLESGDFFLTEDGFLVEQEVNA